MNRLTAQEQAEPAHGREGRTAAELAETITRLDPMQTAAGALISALNDNMPAARVLLAALPNDQKRQIQDAAQNLANQLYYDLPDR